MIHTTTFTEAHEAELRSIATGNNLASKIAQTILKSDIYRASSKQVEILNQESCWNDIEFFISNDYEDKYNQAAAEREREVLRNL